MEGLRGYWALGLLMTIVGVGLLTRLVVIQSGHLKGPLLHAFEGYQRTSYRHNALRDMALYTGMGVGGIVLVMAHYLPLSPQWLSPVFLLWCVAALAHWLGADLKSVMPLPSWFAHFLRMTDALERRRIAYAWLNITPAMRMHFNAHDDDFFAWVDLVMLASIDLVESASI